MDNFIPKQTDGEESTILYNKIVIPVVNIRIEPDEYNLCEKSAENMWCNNKKGSWGRGYKNTNVDKRKVERTGRLGEMAVGKLLGTGINLSYEHLGDKEDTTFHGKSIDVKTAMSLYGCLLVRCEMNGRPIKLSSDLYVFCYISNDNRKDKTAVISVLGYLPVKEVMLKPKVPKFNQNWVNHRIGYNEVYPIKKIFDV